MIKFALVCKVAKWTCLGNTSTSLCKQHQVPFVNVVLENVSVVMNSNSATKVNSFLEDKSETIGFLF